MCFFLLTCLLQKHSGTASILVLKSMPNSLMCTEPGLLDPKLSSVGSSDKGDSNEKRVYPPQRSITTYSRTRKLKKLQSQEQPQQKPKQQQEKFKHNGQMITDISSFKSPILFKGSFQNFPPSLSSVGHRHTQCKK